MAFFWRTAIFFKSVLEAQPIKLAQESKWEWKIAKYNVRRAFSLSKGLALRRQKRDLENFLQM